MDDLDWRQRGACRGENPELFYPVGDSGPALLQLAAAKEVCGRCPVRQDCLDYAMASGEQHGVFGGLSADERRKRRSGRPPKAVVVWSLERDEPPRPQCGSEAAYTAHRRRGEQPCDPCRLSANAAAARRVRERALVPTPPPVTRRRPIERVDTKEDLL